MSTRKLFLVATNLLGLNLSRLALPMRWIVASQIFINSFSIYLTWNRIVNWRKISVFFYIGLYQMVVPILMYVIMTLRTLAFRKEQKEVFDVLDSVPIQNSKKERKFLISLFILIVVRIMKLALANDWPNVIYVSTPMFSELMHATNDIMFAYFFDSLSDQLQFASRLLMKNRDNSQIVGDIIIQNILAKRKIQTKFSIELMITIAYNFLQLSISMYWVVIRLLYGYLNVYTGESFQSTTHKC